MRPVDVAVVPTGTANLASVRAGLERAGARAELVRTPAAVRSAARLVLPGVGAFGAGMQRLRELELVDALRERIAEGRPTLAVCLGLQLLCRASEEAGGVAGVGALDVDVRRFPSDVRVPQLGWNRVEPDADCRTLTPGYAYFANGYRLDAVPEGWAAARSEHGGRFVAAVERGPAVLCQFHPELSGAWGRGLIERWLGGATSC